MPVTSSMRIRIEKSATDNGLDVSLPDDGEWLAWRSSHAPLRIWITALGDALFLVALSQANVHRALAGLGTPFASPLPAGAAGALGVTDFGALHSLLRRALQLSRTLPDELLRAFTAKTATMPRTTEAERFVVQRVGQDLFRQGLLEFWDGRCAITGLAVPALLRASHIKAWAACDRDEERLDVYNGLLLAAHLDAAFDGGLITVADDGGVIVSPTLGAHARAILGLEQPIRVRGLREGHHRYLAWHRERLVRA